MLNAKMKVPISAL